MAGKASLSMSGGSGVFPSPGGLPEAVTPVEYKCSSRENKDHKAAEQSGHCRGMLALYPCAPLCHPADPGPGSVLGLSPISVKALLAI